MKKLVVAPTGEWVEKLLTINILKRVEYFIDKAGHEKIWYGKPVFPHEYLLTEDKENVLIIIADTKYYEELSTKLKKMGFKENVHFYNGWRLSEDFFLNIQDCNWQQFEAKTQNTFKNLHWDKRARMMVSMIPDDVKSIVDFGCGNRRLENYLNPDITYMGLDYISRGKDTIVCDVNTEKLPVIDADCAFMAGFLCYVSDLENFLRQLNYKYLLMSYSGIECYNVFSLFQNRRGLGCLENYKYSWEIVKMVLSHGYVMLAVNGISFEKYYLFKREYENAK